MVLNKKYNIPGAGTYEDVTRMHPTGAYNCNSEMNNSKSARWSKDEKLKAPGSRFEKYPGPGYYKHLGNVSDEFTIAGQYHTIKTRHFGSEKRIKDLASRNKTPGPGTYVPPSDFGYVTLKRNRDLVEQIYKPITLSRRRNSQLKPIKAKDYDIQSSTISTKRSKIMANVSKPIETLTITHF